jgi:hypothetical protein
MNFLMPLTIGGADMAKKHQHRLPLLRFIKNFDPITDFAPSVRPITDIRGISLNKIQKYSAAFTFGVRSFTTSIA